MKLAEWARRNAVHYQTAWQWARDGNMPVPVTKTATGRYLVLAAPVSTDTRAVAYCRVSSADQKPDLQRQAGRVAAGATALGSTLSTVLSEVGSGLDARRPKLAKLLSDPGVSTIVVERRDRLDDAQLADDLVRDMTKI